MSKKTLSHIYQKMVIDRQITELTNQWKLLQEKKAGLEKEQQKPLRHQIIRSFNFGFKYFDWKEKPNKNIKIEIDQIKNEQQSIHEQIVKLKEQQKELS